MTTDLTQTELTRLATVLGIEREVWGELWKDVCPHCNGLDGAYTIQYGEGGEIVTHCGYCENQITSELQYDINLPSPLSDSPRACMWDGFILRALGSSVGTFETPVGSYGVNNARGGDYYGATLTAALFRAFEAARPDWRVG